MNEHDVLQELVRFIGVRTYGKERWFKQNGSWYDRFLGKYVPNEELLNIICGELEDEIGSEW